MDSRSLDDHGNAYGLQRVPYSQCDLFGQTLLDWRMEAHDVEFMGSSNSASSLKRQLLSVCLLTLKSPAENLHNPAERRAKGYGLAGE